MITGIKKNSVLDLPGGSKFSYKPDLDKGLELLSAGDILLLRGDETAGIDSLQRGIDLLENIPLPLSPQVVFSRYRRVSISEQRALTITVQESISHAREIIEKHRLQRENSPAILPLVKTDVPKQSGLSRTIFDAPIGEKQNPDRPPESDSPKQSKDPFHRLPVDLRISSQEEEFAIPLQKTPNSKALLLIMSFLEDNLVLDHAGLNVLLAVACNDGFDEKISLSNIEYNTLPLEMEGVDLKQLRAGIYGGSISGYHVSAVCGGLTKYFYRDLEETFEEWYLNCTKVKTPDFVEQYLFRDEVQSRDSRLSEIKELTGKFILKAKKDGVLIEEGNLSEYGFLLTLLNLNAGDKEGLAKVKKALGNKKETRAKLTELRNRLQQCYGTLPERITIGPLASYLKKRGSSSEQVPNEVHKICDWLELPIPVITTYMKAKGVNLT